MGDESMPRAGEHLQQGEAEPTAELLREALDETRELVRLEVALAREELTAELSLAKAAVACIGAAGALVVSGVTLMLAAIALAFTKAWIVSLVIGGILVVLAGAIGFGGWKSIPRKLLGETRERIGSDLKQLKERIA